MTSEKQAQKFHTDDTSVPRSWVMLLIGKEIQPTRSTTQIWVMLLIGKEIHGISALISQTSFGGETSGSVAKCRLFSEVKRVQITKLSCLPFELTD